MKLNLAALPKEDAWRIFRAGLDTGIVVGSGSAELGAIDDASGMERAFTRLEKRVGALRSDYGPDCGRLLFERWWASETGGGTP